MSDLGPVVSAVIGRCLGIGTNGYRWTAARCSTGAASSTSTS